MSFPEEEGHGGGGVTATTATQRYVTAWEASGRSNTRELWLNASVSATTATKVADHDATRNDTTTNANTSSSPDTPENVSSYCLSECSITVTLDRFGALCVRAEGSSRGHGHKQKDEEKEVGRADSASRNTAEEPSSRTSSSCHVSFGTMLPLHLLFHDTHFQRPTNHNTTAAASGVSEGEALTAPLKIFGYGVRILDVGVLAV